MDLLYVTLAACNHLVVIKSFCSVSCVIRRLHPITVTPTSDRGSTRLVSPPNLDYTTTIDYIHAIFKISCPKEALFEPAIRGVHAGEPIPTVVRLYDLLRSSLSDRLSSHVSKPESKVRPKIISRIRILSCGLDSWRRILR